VLCGRRDLLRRYLPVVGLTANETCTRGGCIPSDIIVVPWLGTKARRGATPTFVSGHGIGNGRRGEPIRYRRLGSLKQFQRLGAMSQSMAAVTQSMGRATSDAPPQLEAPNAPRQQPQHQQH